MPLWVWVLLILAGVFLLLLLLFRVRFRLDWEGGLRFSGSFDCGFPGFNRVFKFPSVTDSTEIAEAAPAQSEAEIPPAGNTQEATPQPGRKPSKPSFNRNRAQRALFLFVTSPSVLRGLIRYGLRSLGMIFRLLHLELSGVLSHSNPAQLGKWAGYWYATKPFVPTRRVNVEFDFERRSTSLRLHARGGFNGAQALACLLLLFGSFPWFLLAKKAWRSWRTPELRGWRKLVFGWMHKAPKSSR